jgi:chemotaxis protein histidine kinase CheA
MSQPLNDYFALEAGEYLDQMDALLAADEPDEPERLFRLARGVRGSAQMADAQEIARVAARLEQVGRAMRDGRLPLSENVRARLQRTVDDLRVLVRGHRSWGPAEERRAREAVARWTEFGDARGGSPAEAGEAQLFAFARRELEAVVAELDRAREEMERAPAVREPLRRVLRRMRPVRGLAGVEALAGVSEVLEGIEEIAQDILTGVRSWAAPERELLATARDTLEALGGALGAEGGAPLPEAPVERFRALREQRAETDGDVVPVASLFHDDAGPHIVSSPAAPVPLPGGAADAVVDFLRIEATGFLDRAEALLERSPRPVRVRFTGVARQLADLARAVGELAAAYGMGDVARAAERAGDQLRDSRDADMARAPLAALRASLPGAEPVPEPARAPERQESVHAEAPPTAGLDAADSEPEVVPIASLLLRGEAALRAALALRPEVERAADADPALHARLHEVWELIEMGLDAAPAR